MPVIAWFRRDLRLHDNAMLQAARAQDAEVIAAYCLPPEALFPHPDLGFSKTGNFRANFLRESLTELKEKLEAQGVPFFFFPENPEDALPRLAEHFGASHIFYSAEYAHDEREEEKALAAALPEGRRAVGVKQFTLFPEAQLPFPVADLPDIFTQFRKAVEKRNVWQVQPEVEEVVDFKPIDCEKQAKIPIFFDDEALMEDDRAVLPFRGGEDAALARLEDYFWKKDALKNYKKTRNGLLGADYSSKFSAWLSLGCLSPRRVYYEVKRYEKNRIKNSSTYWLIFELLWRDYFQFVSLKYNEKLFLKTGLQGKDLKLRNDETIFWRWAEGKTGNRFIDANMVELRQTGFMSNRGRQNVASYLVNDLGVNWTWGAAWFEHFLVDYDPAANWGNWAYVAGVGNAPRPHRYFNPKAQAERYDPKGLHAKQWLG